MACGGGGGHPLLAIGDLHLLAIGSAIRVVSETLLILDSSNSSVGSGQTQTLDPMGLRLESHVGNCQDHGPFREPWYHSGSTLNTAPLLFGTHKGTGLDNHPTKGTLLYNALVPLQGDPTDPTPEPFKTEPQQQP